jgi:hypothetical protein
VRLARRREREMVDEESVREYNLKQPSPRYVS